MTTFTDLGLPRPITSTLEKQGITAPFPIQSASIPDILAGRDVAGRAPTGSGKTLAFGLPMLTRVPQAAPHRPTALILAPTRELAGQIRAELAPYGKAVHRQVYAVFGGVRYGAQRDFLRRGIDVLVATPGRLEDLIEQGDVSLADVEIVSIDEADRMADMGFLPAVRRIVDATSSSRQTLLFSATLEGEVGALIERYQHRPIRHEAEAIEPETIDAQHHFWLVERTDKVRHTATVVERTDRSIVFTRTRHGADRLARQLAKLGVNAVAMHGGRSQNQRTRALDAFASGKASALVATDVAARGIHVDRVASVVHFDPPADHTDYVHRSGRTGRAGATGDVVSLVTGEQRRTVRKMQMKLDLSEPIGHPELEALGAATDRSTKPTPKTQTKQAHPSPRTTTAGRPPKKSKAPKATRTRHANKPGDLATLRVGNLPWATSDRDLNAAFEAFGSVHRAEIRRDKRGRSKGVGFVEMMGGDAVTAERTMHGSTIGGRKLTVRRVLPATPRRG